MDLERDELLPGVWLTALRTDRFKTGTLSVSLLTQLSADTAAANAAVPYVLRRGTALRPDMSSLAEYMDELYGAAVEPSVRRVGELQAAGFFASFPEDRFVPGGGVLARAAALMGELLLSPATRGGLLLPDYVASEKQKLAERIRAQKNNKNAWAVQRLIENMCAFEDFSVGRWGGEADAEAIHYQKLTRRWRELVSSSPAELFYCGAAPFSEAAAALRDAFAAMPRGDVDFDIGTDVRMNSVEAEPRYFTEELPVAQCRLAIGWRLGECMEEPDPAAIRVFNAVFGGGVTSKLFMNVREKLSLCYYASSAVNLHKGLLIVSSGISADKYGAARDEIFAQLEAIRRGDVTQEELEWARRGVASDLRALADDPGQLEQYWLDMNVSGETLLPGELADLAGDVTLGDVAAVAQSVECDAVYFLKGTGGAEDE